MARREQSGFDGDLLVLVHHSPEWTRWFGLAACFGVLISAGCIWLSVWGSRHGLGAAVVVTAFVSAVALVLCVPFVVTLVSRPPTLQVDAAGILAQPDRTRTLEIPWASVRSVGTASKDGRRVLYVVHVDPDHWDRLGTRWFGEGERRRWLPDLRDKITLRLTDLDLAEALRITRKLAPSEVRVDTLDT